MMFSASQLLHRPSGISSTGRMTAAADPRKELRRHK
jgi:hypothetical protein